MGIKGDKSVEMNIIILNIYARRVCSMAEDGFVSKISRDLLVKNALQLKNQIDDSKNMAIILAYIVKFITPNFNTTQTLDKH